MRGFARVWMLIVLASGCWAIRPVPAAEVASAGEDAPMRPTRLGIRLTPGIARGLARVWVGDVIGRDSSISEAQQRQLAGAVARELIEQVRADARALRDFIEYGMEAMAATSGRFSPEVAQEFGRRSPALVKTGREVIQALSGEADRRLPPAQQAEIEDKLREHRAWLTKFERRMTRWSNGEAGDDEQPFDVEHEGAESQSGKPLSEPMRRAQRSVDWEMRRLGPENWSRFLRNAGEFFEFDEAQSAKGRELLVSYKAKAAAIKTTQWKADVRRNRTKYHLQWTLRGQPTSPWVYRLERDYKKAVKPIRDLERAFYGEIIGLATPAQREAALTVARRAGREHGLADEELRVLPKLGGG